MAEQYVIKSDTCDLYVERGNQGLILFVKEDGLDGKVDAMTVLSKEDAKKLRDHLDVFINS